MTCAQRGAACASTTSASAYESVNAGLWMFGSALLNEPPTSSAQGQKISTSEARSPAAGIPVGTGTRMLLDKPVEIHAPAVSRSGAAIRAANPEARRTSAVATTRARDIQA